MQIEIKPLGLQPYEQTWQAMQDFTLHRDESTPDEIWLVQHPSIFTQGLNGKAEHILKTPNIPIVQTDRGGQITYHAPGQAIVYVLVDLKRIGLGVRALVNELEKSIIEYLAGLGINSQAKPDAPGVYVNDKKIASLGLKIKKHRSYHGLALNVDMDLQPFKMVNPCGLQGMEMTQLKNEIETVPTVDEASWAIAKILQDRLQSV